MVSVPFGPSTLNVWSSVNVAQPSTSVILFFFIKKCTPLAIRSAAVRLRFHAAPKSKVASPLMPKTSASWLKMCAISAFRNSDFVGMQPTLLQTPPQYFSSMMPVFRPSCAARTAAT